MPASAGPMNQRVQFLRRIAGEYQTYGDWQWAAYSYERAASIGFGGLQFWGKTARLTVRNSLFAAGLRTSDRARIGDTTFQITIVKTPSQDDDDLDIEVQTALNPMLYGDLMDSRGEIVTLRRIVPNGSPIDVQARAIVTGYQPQELGSGIDQGDRRVFLYGPDVAAAGFPLPIKNGGIDRLIIRGRTLAIQAVDDSTHRIAGELQAFDIQARGA